MGIKKFFKKNLRDIVTVIGAVVLGPVLGPAAGAAVGQGVGSLAEGRSLKDSVVSSAKIYAAGKIGEGAGLGQPGADGTKSTLKFGEPMSKELTSGIGGTFQDLGAAGRNTLFPKAGSDGASLNFTDRAKAQFGKEGALQTGYNELGFMGKAGVGALGLAGLGGFDSVPEPNNQMPGATSQYLTRGLTPARLSNAYSTAGIPVGAPQGGNALDSSFAGYDPINQAYAALLDKTYGEMAFPEFSQSQIKGAKDGGGIARLMDGGELPQMDLRENGGDINDPEGSGDEDTVPALLADGEFVMTKQAVAGMGNGNHDTGIANLYAMMDINENKAQSMGIGRA
tara:strand:- start:3984 stop:5000 length:1017 start_codon:yes stop_codon:yes gene_type:complete